MVATGSVTFEEVGVIVEEIPCRECGQVTVVGALGWAALPVVDEYVGSCCRRYIGDLDFPPGDS